MAANADDSQRVSRWIQQVKAGDHAALERIWRTYLKRLLRLVRRRVREGPSHFADEDDVVQSAFKSFFIRARNGRFPALDDRDALCRLLTTITLTKARALNRKEGHRQELLERRFCAPRRLPNQTSPAGESQSGDEFRRLLDELDNDLLRSIAVGKSEGLTNAEIAERVGKSVPTIERKLRIIRACWSAHAPQEHA